MYTKLCGVCVFTHKHIHGIKVEVSQCRRSKTNGQGESDKGVGERYGSNVPNA